MAQFTADNTDGNYNDDQLLRLNDAIDASITEALADDTLCPTGAVRDLDQTWLSHERERTLAWLDEVEAEESTPGGPFTTVDALTLGEL